VRIVPLHRCNPGLWSVALYQPFVQISGESLLSRGLWILRVSMWVLTVMRTGCDIVDNYNLRCAVSSDDMKAFDA
jgi:hypothetical protein